jgi:hypothetical protein
MPSKLNAISTGTPSLKFTAAGDGALEIQNDGNTAITISNTGISTFASQPVVPVPAFRARASGDQSITSTTVTTVNLPTVDYDTNSWFDNTTNYRYTPQIPGYYFFRGLVWCDGTNMTTQAVYVSKNGDRYSGCIYRLSTSSPMGIEVSTTAYMNGSTDYVELQGFVTGTSPSFISLASPSDTWATSTFEGFLVRTA